MNKDFRKSVRRLLLLDMLYGFTKSVSNNINELGDDIDEVFRTAAVKRGQLRGIFTEEQNDKRNNI